jgi:hypothetical protein
MIGGLIWVALMWFLQAQTDTPIATQQPGHEGGSRMKKVLQKTIVNLMANASTAYYVNNLPALTVRAPRLNSGMLK